MRKLFAVFLLLFFALSWQQAGAVTVWYQPTPYPKSVIDAGATKTPPLIPHITDGWMNSYYDAIKPFQQDDKLQIGGWGDVYNTYVRFDLIGLPSDVTQAALWLMPYPRDDSSTPTGVDFWWPPTSWGAATMTWGNQPAVQYPQDYYGGRAAPTANQWWGTDITGTYNGWKNNTRANNGVRLEPWLKNNNFDMFRSSRYADYVNDPYADGKRPMLGLTFASTLDLKMPLSGNHTWLVTTEVGGYDCRGSYDSAHDGLNYFSIDFSWKNVPDSGATVYPNPDPTLNRLNNGVYIPVIAAAGGNVVFAGTDPSKPDNGYFVVINHSGGIDETTGFTTRYLHLQPPGPIVTIGNTVVQGQTIGYVGNTGLSDGAHLHFGVRYNNSGAKMVPELTKVVVDDWILKGFQSECLNGTWNRYYRSWNRVY